jgi:hypothetical protein
LPVVLHVLAPCLIGCEVISAHPMMRLLVAKWLLYLSYNLERVGRVELRIIGLEDRWAPLATIYPHLIETHYLVLTYGVGLSPAIVVICFNKMSSYLHHIGPKLGGYPVHVIPFGWTSRLPKIFSSRPCKRTLL